jgi:catechol 2,3-dioxygenase-like lactoylglutathione lyase family enzyme
MNIHRIDHVSLDVRDRPGSVAWYQAVLGLQTPSLHDVPDEPVFLGRTGARFGLFAEPTRPRGLRHIALATDSAGQDGLVSRLDRLLIPYTREQHRDSDSIYFRDPDGTTLEVMVPTK